MATAFQAVLRRPFKEMIVCAKLRSSPRGPGSRYMSASGTGKGAENEGERTGALANWIGEEEFEVVCLAFVSPYLGCF